MWGQEADSTSLKGDRSPLTYILLGVTKWADSGHPLYPDIAAKHSSAQKLLQKVFTVCSVTEDYAYPCTDSAG